MLGDDEFDDVLDGRRKFAYIQTFIDSKIDNDGDAYVDENDYYKWVEELGVKPIESTAEGDADGYRVFVKVLEPLSPNAKTYESYVIDGIDVGKDEHFDMIMDEFGPWPE